MFSPDLHHGFGQQLGSEQLEHGVHDVLPALPQDVAVPMGEVKHRLGCRLGLVVTAEHCGEVLHRLHRERTQPSVNRHAHTDTASAHPAQMIPCFHVGHPTVSCLCIAII